MLASCLYRSSGFPCAPHGFSCPSSIALSLGQGPPTGSLALIITNSLRHIRPSGHISNSCFGIRTLLNSNKAEAEPPSNINIPNTHMFFLSYEVPQKS